MAATTSTSTITQPAYCAYSRDIFPTILSPQKYYVEVPLYQESYPHANKTEILKSCCESNVWLYSDPEPCTAVCNAKSAAQVQRISYCLNAQPVAYGGFISAAGLRAPLVKYTWSLVLVSGLVLSGVLS